MNAIVNINIADVRREPTHSSERVTQGLFNEPVDTLKSEKGMTRIRFADGYEGWISDQFLTEFNTFQGDGPFFVNVNLAPALERMDVSSRRLTHIPYSCVLFGQVASHFLRMESHRYGAFYLDRANLIEANMLAPPKELTAAVLKNEAEKFLGAPYLWGGRSFFGFDCSGFVKAIMQRFGVGLPRDSKDQIKMGQEIGRNDMRNGDLVFFPGHVALALGESLIIHSSRSNGGVAFNSLDSKSSLYRSDLDRTLVAVRRVLG